MKQLAFLTMALLGGAFGALVHPFYGILPYYMLTVVRPQSLWDYALPEGVRWSLVAAMIAMVGAVIHTPKILTGIRWNPVATLLAVFTAMVAIGVLAAQNTAVGGSHGTQYMKMMIMAMLATAVIHRLAHLRILLFVILAGITYVAWEYNVRYLLDNRLDIFFEGHGGLDNNDTGVILAIGFVLSYWLWQARRSWLLRAGTAVAALFMVHALMLSYSRSGMVAAAAGLGWLALWHRPRRQLLLLLPLLLLAIVHLAGPEVRQEFTSIKQYEEDATAQKRLDSWARGWETAWDYPLTGAGLRNSNLMSAAYGAELNDRSIHNIYLQIAADSGIPALLVYMAMIATAVALLWRFRQDLTRRTDGPRRRRDRSDKPADAEDDHAHDDPRELAGLCLALEAALITFAAGGVFLSLEFFELPYLLLVMAGLAPVLGRAEAAEARTDRGVRPALDAPSLDPAFPSTT